MLNRSRCVVLVPVYEHIDRQCEESLLALEERGYRVRRVWAGAAIDVARSKMATAMLDEGYEEIMWIDSDIVFPVDAVDRLRDRDLPIVSGVYPKKAESSLSFHAIGMKEVNFGEYIGGLIEIGYAATGFLYTRREVYEAIQRVCHLPVCNETFGERVIPFFLPQIIEDPPDRHWYLAEDYSFSHRARQAGYKILADTTFRLWHVGRYAYSWEDGCGDRERFMQFRLGCTSPDRPGLEVGQPAPNPYLARFPDGPAPAAAAPTATPSATPTATVTGKGGT
jgi:hypothetical protein